MPQIMCVRFCNEVTVNIKNGFENNVKFLKNVSCTLDDKFLTIHKSNRDITNEIKVPITNIAGYWIES